MMRSRIRIKSIKKGFSLIELIFVIVVLGILSSVSLSLIFNVYQNYISQKALSSLTQKTDIISSIIVHYISNRIKGTIITKSYTNNSDYAPLDTNLTSSTYNVLEWIGYDYDGFSSFKDMTWSGIANYETVRKDATNSVFFETPASNLNKLSSVLKNLSNDRVSLDKDSSPAIIFKQKNNYYDDKNLYSPECMGLTNSTNRDCIFSVYSNNIDKDRLFFKNTNRIKRNITERYQLAWTAYSIYIDKGSSETANLYLYYNYQPWNGDMIRDVESKRKLLAENVSVFKYTKSSNIIKLKICLQEKLTDRVISACKLRTVI